MELQTLFDEVNTLKGSDIHLVTGEPPVYRVDGRLQRREGAALTEEELLNMLSDALEEPYRSALGERQVSFDVTLRQGSHIWRMCVYRERGRLAATIRVGSSGKVPTIADLYGSGPVAEALTRLMQEPRGLIVVTGPTGSGKSTTAAAMLETVNQTTPARILTVEDPVQYDFQSKTALITQQAVGEDVPSYREGLLAAFRGKDPDIVLVGDLQDLESIQLALTLAETGHLVLTTMHVETASEAVNRLVEVFPEAQRGLIRRSLARNLVAVIAQRLFVRSDRSGRVPANEILLMNLRVRQMIAGGEEDFTSAIEAGREQGMRTMDDSIVELYQGGTIAVEAAWLQVADPRRLGPPQVASS